jgi:uncharacterized Zn-finger protein
VDTGSASERAITKESGARLRFYKNESFSRQNRFFDACDRVFGRYDPPEKNEVSMTGRIVADTGKVASLALDPPEVIEVDDTRVACDGGGGALGHPRVFLEIGEGNFIDCPYCDRRFKLRDGASAHL